MAFPSCSVHDQTVQYIAQECGYTSAQVYAAFQLLHTDARESTVAAMMKGTKTYTGSSSDNVILKSELERSPILRELLLKYGILLDGGFHPTSIRREKECDDAEDRKGKGCDGAEEEGDEQDDEAEEEEGDGNEGDMGLAKLFFPIRKPKIWRKYLAPGETLEQYMAHVEYCLEYNERHGFMRARIEHRYGPSGIGHFSGLMERRWLHDADYVLFAFKFVCIGRSLDILFFISCQNDKNGKTNDKYD